MPLLLPLLCCSFPPYDTRLACWQGFYDVALRKEAERRAEAEEEYQVCATHSLYTIGPIGRLILACNFTVRKRMDHVRVLPQRRGNAGRHPRANRGVCGPWRWSRLQTRVRSHFVVLSALPFRRPVPSSSSCPSLPTRFSRHGKGGEHDRSS